ncbi:hypothetical protein AB0F88_16870 [Streptosporangium sp. NPDC023963]|uniref:hypothetical protein n=1 Tax=Streptosporangium sp. NPDC023963 TaxID=3155608 RepID=UPI003431E097
MAVEPQPCAPGGGGGTDEGCCSPSITSQALCLADGTPILLVVRSGCACGSTPAGNPETAGWIDPATGAFTPGPAPAGAGPCDGGCLDVTTVQLCDLTPGGGCVPFLRHLVRDCDGAITSSTDTALDGTTAYTVVGTAGDCSACSAECVDTICVQRCDDTDGDGTADQTYSELWCVRADGSAELVLTYQDDPSVPYTPVTPVECTYGCPESETVTLCDESGPFLRRYTFLAGTATYEDVALDGQTPHVVTGTVGVCASGSAEPCAEQTTPAATLGLCLADGTPIAVVLTRDCAGTITQDGWINLTTGTWSAGAPPVGTQACGDSRAFELAGLLCDTDPATGDVLGLVLVEYAYNPDGSLASVRLVNPATGTTYTLQGELRNCPGGSAAQPEQDLVKLCDTAADETVTEFLRDYRRDTVGAIVGHSDYTLDGAAYVPAGTVGACPEPPCSQCQTHILCDLPANTETADVPGAATSGPGSETGTLPNGVDYTITGATRIGGHPWFGIGANGVGPQTWTFTQPVTATWAVRIIRQNSCAVLPEGTELVQLAAVHTWDPATRTLCATADNNDASIYSTFRHPAAVTSLTFDMSGQGNAGLLRTVGLMAVTPVTVPFQRTTCRGCTGEATSTTDTTLDGEPYTPAGTVGVCGPTAGTGTEPCGHSEALPLCDVATDGTSTPFLRHLVYDCAGAVTSTADTELDGITPYVPAGTVQVCAPALGVDVETYPLCVIDNATGNVIQHVRREVVYDAAGAAVAERFVDAVTGGPVALPGGTHIGVCPSESACQNCQTVPLCDTGIDNSSFEQVPISILPNGGGGLGSPDWPYVSVGVNQGGWVANPGYWITVPPQAQQWQVGAPVYMRLGIKGLAPGETISINTPGYVVESLSPNHVLVGNVLTGGPASTGADETVLRYDTPGQQFILQPQSGDGSGLSFLQVSLEEPWVTEAVATPFLRTVCRDCDGVTTTVTDTALDGTTPYTVLGEVGVCQPPAEVPEVRLDVETHLMCFVDEASGDVLGQALVELVYDDQTGDRTQLRFTDPTTGDPVTPPAGAILAACGNTTGQCRDSTTLMVCDVTTTATPVTPTVVDAAAADLNLGAAFPALGGVYSALWSGGTLNYPADPNASAGDGIQVYRAAAGRVTASPANCAGATGALTVSARVTLNGPNPGAGNDGSLRIYRGTTLLAADNALFNAPVGHVETLTASTMVTAEDLASGDLYVALWLETFHSAPKAWTADQFMISAELDGCAVQFLRTVVVDCETGETISTADTTLDGDPYTVTGDVGQCTAAAGGGSCCPTEPCPAKSVIKACRCDDTDGDGIGDTDYVELLGVGCDGSLTSLGTYTEDLSAPYTPVAPVECPVEGAPPAQCPTHLLKECRWDDTTGDGLGDTTYVELISVDGCTGALTSLGTYTEDLAGPYTPVAPTTECPVEGASPAHGVQARRAQLAPAQSWSAAGVPLLQSVTATAHGGTGQITTVDGISTLFQGESVTWSLTRDGDAMLAGPLIIAAQTGTVTITYTTGVTL